MENTSSKPQNDTDTSTEPTLESLEKTMGPVPSDQFAERPDEPTPPPVSEPKPKKSKKKLLLVLLAVFVVIGAASAYWFVLRPDETVTAPEQSATESAEQQVSLKPTTIAYAHREQSAGNSSCQQSSTSKFYWRPFNGGERTESGSAPLNNLVTEADIQGKTVAAIVDPTCGAEEPVSVWFSNDAGKSYANIFSGNKAHSSDSLGDQISSVKVASDGTSVLAAFVDGSTSKNTVKEINPTTKQTTDLFTADKAGVFIVGYDKQAGKIYYFTGCFNCGGGARDVLLAYDAATKQTTTVFDQSSDTRFGFSAVFNRDFTKLIMLQGTMDSDDPMPGGPYAISQYDMVQKTTTEIASIATDPEQPPQIPDIGYTADENLPYYVQDKSVMVVGADGKATAVFEATNAIHQVHYLSKNNAIVSSGSSNDFSLANYDYTTKQATTLLGGDENTTIFGVGLL